MTVVHHALSTAALLLVLVGMVSPASSARSFPSDPARPGPVPLPGKLKMHHVIHLLNDSQRISGPDHRGRAITKELDGSPGWSRCQPFQAAALGFLGGVLVFLFFGFFFSCLFYSKYCQSVQVR